MTDLIRDLIRFLRYNADYDLVDGLVRLGLLTWRAQEGGGYIFIA